MLEEWLVDGYNVLRDGSLQNRRANLSRETLFDWLVSFASCGERAVLMVLDGHGKNEEFQSYKTKSFRVIYSKKVTADSLIEKMLYEKKGLSSFIVVTRDRALSQMARGLSARVMEPAEFIGIVKASVKENDPVLFKEKVRSHGFSRPFENKLNYPIE